MFNFTYDASFFMVIFFMFVPLALASLSRQVAGWRKLLWMALTAFYSWLALIALWVLVPRNTRVDEERSPWQQRIWVVAVLSMLTVWTPMLGFWSDRHLSAPVVQGLNRNIETAYQALGRGAYARDILQQMRTKHGWRYQWHRFFTNATLLQHETVGLNPEVRVKFADGSVIRYSIKHMSSQHLIIEERKGQDADGNVIHIAREVKQYSGDSGTLSSPKNIASFTEYLQKLGVEVTNEVPDSQVASWRCSSIEVGCRIFISE